MKGVEKMKKTLTKIVTLLLAVSLVFGVVSTTVLAAPEVEQGGQVESGSVSEEGKLGGELINGWCDIISDENGIKVVITPDTWFLFVTMDIAYFATPPFESLPAFK